MLAPNLPLKVWWLSFCSQQMTWSFGYLQGFGLISFLDVFSQGCQNPSYGIWVAFSLRAFSFWGFVISAGCWKASSLTLFNTLSCFIFISDTFFFCFHFRFFFCLPLYLQALLSLQSLHFLVFPLGFVFSLVISQFLLVSLKFEVEVFVFLWACVCGKNMMLMFCS